MGCWNATCGLSNLPIQYNDPVVVFFVGISPFEKPATKEHCYSTDQALPLTLPFFGKYDDYGGVREIEENKNTEAILRYFREHGILDNRFFDDPLPLSEWAEREGNELDFEKLVEFASDGSFREDVSVVGEDRKMPVGLFMVRQDIVDRLDGFVDVPEDLSVGDVMTYGSFSMLGGNKKYRYLDPYSRRGMLEKSVEDLWEALPEKRNPKDEGLIDISSDDFNEESLAYKKVSVAMSHLRKSWFPKSGRGSQDCGYDKHKAFAEAIIEVCDEKIDAGENY